jgi:hypothetical protein
MATPHTTLPALAQQTTPHIGFTLRRGWREKTEPTVLRVEVERRLVRAPPAITVLTVAIAYPPAARRPSPAQASSSVRSQPSIRPTRQATGTRPTSTPQKSRGRQQERSTERASILATPSRHPPWAGSEPGLFCVCGAGDYGPLSRFTWRLRAGETEGVSHAAVSDNRPSVNFILSQIRHFAAFPHLV